jgi:hypothetical protein
MSTVLAPCDDAPATCAVREPGCESVSYVGSFRLTAHALGDGEPITLSALIREVLADARAGSLPSAEDPPGALLRSC